MPVVLLPVFILYSVFIHANVLAGPLQPLHPMFENFVYPREDPNNFTPRSESSIVWGCLATIFACSWVAVHPNIPAPSGSIFLTRLKLMGCMLIAPELVIIWAARQWYAAHRIAEHHNDKGVLFSYGSLINLVIIKLTLIHQTEDGLSRTDFSPQWGASCFTIMVL